MDAKVNDQPIKLLCDTCGRDMLVFRRFAGKNAIDLIPAARQSPMPSGFSPWTQPAGTSYLLRVLRGDNKIAVKVVLEDILKPCSVPARAPHTAKSSVPSTRDAYIFTRRIFYLALQGSWH